jgi:hypothetical protein
MRKHFLLVLGITLQAAGMAKGEFSGDSITFKGDEIIWSTSVMASEYANYNQSMLFGTAVPEQRAEIIDIFRDGATCPEGYESSVPRKHPYYVQTCKHDSYVANRYIKQNEKVRCCFHPEQHIFLLSKEGGEHHLSSQYILDGRPCCIGAEEEGAALVNGRCSYGNSNLKVAAGEVTQCCWNRQTKDFNVHLQQFKPLSMTLNQRQNIKATTQICELDVNIWLDKAWLYSSHLDVHAAIDATCSILHLKDKGPIRINFDTRWTHAGEFEFKLPPIGSVRLDLKSRIDSANHTIQLSGTITGPGISHQLNHHIDHPALQAFLQPSLLCHA